MEFTWVPKGKIKDDADDSYDYSEIFTGHLKIKIKPKSERLKQASAMHSKLTMDGKQDLQAGAIDKIEDLDKFVEESIVEWNLKTIDPEMEIKSIADLGMFEAGVLLTNKLAGIAINGIPMGKK